MELNKIYNEDCLKFISQIEDNSLDMVMTSPPYNTSISKSQEKRKEDLKNKKEHTRAHSYNRYDSDVDSKSENEYAKWVENIFNSLEPKLKKNAIIAWNVSYGVSENNGDEDGINNSMWYSILNILNNTPFTLAEYIGWEKSNCIPLSIGNKISRRYEPVFIFCRKSEYDTYYLNKNEKRKIGSSIYKNPIHNRVYTRFNNDAQCELNRATYNEELCSRLFQLYCPDKGTVYDPFMGSGTTAAACVACGLNYIGSEISQKQTEWATNRIKKLKGNSLWF